MRNSSLILLLLLASSHSEPTYTEPLKAIALNGKTVSLKLDGTWSYSKETFKRDFDFRHTYWGASMDSVIVSETSERIETPNKEILDTNILYYRTEIDDLPAVLVYVFFRNNLILAKYIFPLEHSNRVESVVDYEHLVAMISIKYGAPIDKNETWKSTLITSSIEDKAAAVAYGHLDLYSIWSSKDVTIDLILSGDSGKSNIVLSFISNEYEKVLIFDQLDVINFNF